VPVSIHQTHPVFVGEVAGIDCRNPLSPDEVAAIEAGMDEYAVLVLRDQNITDEEQIAFTRHFGELESYNTPGHIRRREDSRLRAGIADFSNLDKDGNIISDEDRVWFFKLGDRLWHSDSSFRPIPAKYSLLSGRVLPSWGANTEFADMRAAYDALPGAMQDRLSTLVGLHGRSTGPAGERLYGDDKGTTEKVYHEMRRPAVIKHPVSGRSILFVNPMHTHGFVGMAREVAWPLIEELTNHATQGRFVYYHHWRIGDVLMWDELATMHRGAGDYRPDERRVMLRTIVYAH